MRIKPGVWVVLGLGLLAFGAYSGNNVSEFYQASGGFKAAPTADKLTAIGSGLAGLVTILAGLRGPIWNTVKPWIVEELKDAVKPVVNRLPLGPIITAAVALVQKILAEHPEIYAAIEKEIADLFSSIGKKPPAPKPEVNIDDLSDQQLKSIITRLAKAVDAVDGGKA